jgi:hypothetical protein
MEKNDYLTEFRTSLSGLDIGELRKKASTNFGIKLTRQHTKEDIINNIMDAVSKANYAQAADGDLKPGYARIKLTPIAGKVTFPVYQNTNGYFGFIPPGIECDVPIKVIETLEHAEEIKQVQNEFGEYKDSMQPSYPYQVLAINPGPDPKPGYEVQRERKQAPKRAFFAKHGYWPTDKQMQEYTATGGMIQMFQLANSTNRE